MSPLVKCRICRKNETYNTSGVCVICEKFGEENKEAKCKEKSDKKESSMNLGKVVSEKVCVDCKMKYKPTSNVQKRCPECRQKYNKKKSQVSSSKADKPASLQAIPDPEVNKVIAKSDGKTAYLGQLLYASNLLDGQLNSAIESGDIDTKVILDIRFRLGEVLRGSVEIPA